MPLYRYECVECEEGFEELVFGDEQAACPKCSSKRVERQVTTFATRTAAGPEAMPRMPALPPMPPGACGTCGDPAGPGACAN